MTLPRVGISACLLGQEVRFDGGHKHDALLTDELAKRVPTLIETGPGNRLIARLAAAPADQRRTMREGLVLLQRYLTPPGDASAD